MTTASPAIDHPALRDSSPGKAAFADALPSPGSYMPGLDVLRGLAITAVLFFHGVHNLTPQIRARLPMVALRIFDVGEWGYLGVHLFFVLSGFLITGILLDSRTKDRYYKTFYVHRVLRIMPAYLLMIIVLKLAQQISWIFLIGSLLYIVNLTAGLRGNLNGRAIGDGGVYASFWTLSVEEQFYLVWPFVVRKLRPKHTLYLALTLLFAVPMLRFALQYLPAHFNDIQYKTWAVADFFGGGAALAVAVRSQHLRVMLPKIGAGLTAAAVVLFLMLRLLGHGQSLAVLRLALALQLSPWAFLFTAVVLAGFLMPSLARNAVGQVFVFLGYISYGLYLVQSLFIDVSYRRWTFEGLSEGALVAAVTARFLGAAALSIGLAWVSRVTFEEHFLKLRRSKSSLHSGTDVAHA